MVTTRRRSRLEQEAPLYSASDEAEQTSTNGTPEDIKPKISGPSTSAGPATSTGPSTSAGLPQASPWPKPLKVLLFACLVCGPALVAFLVMDIGFQERKSIAINFGMSVLAFLAVRRLIPLAIPYVLKRNMFGMDINKRGSPGGEVKIPETMGLVVSVCFLVTAILFQHFYYTPDSPWLVEYNAALACICFMAFLGFVDDVLDIPWRVKLILPSFAALPLLMAYSGSTTVVLPLPLRPLLGLEVLDLGWLYKLYMGMLVVFSSNSINILAGVNGVEAGQTAVIAGSVLLFNIWQIGSLPGLKLPLQADMEQAHLFSLSLVQPLLGTTLALLSFNWYPSQVFVGDTFTYFAGMTLAVVGILGHFSETLLLFFLPQVINFIYSLPQLFKIVPCPRHRLPKFDPETGLLTGSNDLNLVNLFLRVFGKCTEEQLCIRLLTFQVFCSILTFIARFMLMGVYK